MGEITIAMSCGSSQIRPLRFLTACAGEAVGSANRVPGFSGYTRYCERQYTDETWSETVCKMGSCFAELREEGEQTPLYLNTPRAHCPLLDAHLSM